MYDILIIGSGLSSSAFLRGFGNKNKKIGLISPSNFKMQNQDLPTNLYKYLYKNLPPRFIKNNINGYANYFLKNKIKVENNISIFGDLSHGGVSKYWGGSCEFPNEKQINFLNNKNKKKLINSYVEIFKENNFYGDLNFSNNKFKKKQKFINKGLNQLFRNLVLKKKSKIVKFFNNINAKNSKTGNLYLPLNLKKLPKNVKKLNFFVTEIRKKNNFYSVLCENDKGIGTIEIFTKKLVLGSGTVSTTKLICKMLKIRKSIKINHNPMLFGIFILKKKIKIEKFAPSRLAAKVFDNKSKLISLTNFRTSNLIIKSKIFDNFTIMKNFFSRACYNILEKNLLFYNLYLDSNFGNLNMQLQNNNEIKIFYKTQKITKIKKKLYSEAKIIYDFLKSKNLILPFKLKFLPPWGNDNHYTGTIPINGSHNKLSLKQNCELKGHKNLFIIDGSSIPNTSVKFPTALIISNAFRIGKDFK